MNREQRQAHARVWPLLALALLVVVSAATLATQRSAAPTTVRTGSPR